MACTSCSQPLPDGARFCPYCGQPVVDAAEERRLITVVFADIVGYSGLVEYLDPERAKRLLDDAFERLIADVVEYGGTVDKVLGDGVLALFGAPVAHEDDADRAVQAALQMHESLADFVTEHDELERPVQLRVGVNTGEVLFGRVGGTDDQTVMGDVVNVASRLETLAPPGEVYVGDSTAALTSPAIQLEQVDDVEVRGREQTEMVWRAIGIQHQPVDLSAAHATPFVGRSEQVDLLASIIAMVTSGQSAVVAVSGEAGSGKTRLITEVLSDAASQAEVFAGECAPYGETNAWAPIAAAMFGRVNPALSLSPDRLRNMAIERSVSTYGFPADDPLLESLAEAVLHIAGHPSVFDDMPLTQARETLFRLIVEALRRRSSQGPLILWIDDLQWADNLMVDLLHQITRSLVDRPFLLITAQRDDADIDWPPAGDQPMTVRMPLEPLGRSDARELIDAITGGSADPLVERQLYERSGGNPLFLTELASLASGREQIELPGSLRVLIAARLDRLSPGQRLIIDNAAVLGSDGAVDSLEYFAKELGQSFSFDDLNQLVTDGLLEISSDSWWTFRSDVIREVAYQTLTKVARAERHAGVARVMGQAPGVPVVRVAHHAARAAELNAEIGPLTTVPADIAEQAVGLLLRAAQRSLDIGAFRQARRDALRALALNPTDEAVTRKLRLLQAVAATELREFDVAGDDARLSLESAIESGDRHDEGVARRLVGVQAHGVGDLATARDELTNSISIFRELDDDAELAVSLADRGFSEIFGGSLAQADALLDESAQLAEKLGDRRAGAWAQQHKALVAFMSGDTELAASRLQVATEQFEKLGDRSGRSWAQAIKAYLAFNERRFDDAEALAGQARIEALKLGERWGPAMMDTLVASIRLWTGNFVEAESLARRSLAAFRDLGDRFGTVQSIAPYVRSLVALGRYQEAERGMEEALTLSDTSGSLAFPAMIAAGTAVHLGLGERGVVIGELALARTGEMGANGAEVHTALALALCQVGRPEEALAHLLASDSDLPYTRAVRSLAHALIADGASAVEDAELVCGDPGASYLDRVIAEIAAAAAQRTLGADEVAAAHLARAGETARSAGDAVAVALSQHACARLLPGATIPVDAQLGQGWHRVLNDLAAATAAE